MNFNRLILAPTVMSVAVLLTACGGGSGSSAGSLAAPTGAITASTDTLAMSSQLTYPSRAQLTISNTTQVHAAVSLAVDSPEYKVEGCTNLPKAGNCTVTVTFLPQQAGSRKAQLTINAAGSTKIVKLEGAASYAPPVPLVRASATADYQGASLYLANTQTGQLTPFSATWAAMGVNAPMMLPNAGLVITPYLVSGDSGQSSWHLGVYDMGLRATTKVINVSDLFSTLGLDAIADATVLPDGHILAIATDMASYHTKRLVKIDTATWTATSIGDLQVANPYATRFFMDGGDVMVFDTDGALRRFSAANASLKSVIQTQLPVGQDGTVSVGSVVKIGDGKYAGLIMADNQGAVTAVARLFVYDAKSSTQSWKTTPVPQATFPSNGLAADMAAGVLYADSPEQVTTWRIADVLAAAGDVGKLTSSTTTAWSQTLYGAAAVLGPR